MGTRSAQAGLSIVELMVAITIGLLLLAGLASMFGSSSRSQNELRRAAEQIENGRYAMDTMTQDLQLAGYFGQNRVTSTPPTSMPDPCTLTIANMTTAVAIGVQGYSSGGLSSRPALPASCATWLPNANLSKGSDVVIVYRTNTSYLPIGTATTAGQLYVQTNPATFTVQNGGGTTSCTSGADGSASSITRRCLTPNTLPDEICSSLCPGGSPVGYIRQLVVHIYFVAPCNVPTGGGSICTGTTDDGGTRIPTLKRLELTASGGAATFQITSIAEGVEFMKVEYGIDDTPSAVNTQTGLVGDGATDRYVLAPALSDLTNAVTVRVDLLVRNPEPSIGYTDSKTYNLGVNPALPTSPAVTVTSVNYAPTYRRHVYSSEIRLVNLSSRKENP
ncbi:MAG TPA: PilW family protein [Burkholderiales bacterium]|nr:PilW family protein [Burkholderiales bacterium]